MKRSKDKLERIDELVEMDNKTELNETELSYDEFMSFINSSLQKIYSYSSGFDITRNEFVDTDIIPSLELGDTIIIFDKDAAPSLKNIPTYTISEIGVGLRDKNRVTLYTLVSVSDDSETFKLTEAELRERAVSVKAYYTRLMAYEREKSIADIMYYVKKKLTDAEHNLDLIAFNQECVINEAKHNTHNVVTNRVDDLLEQVETTNAGDYLAW